MDLADLLRRSGLIQSQDLDTAIKRAQTLREDLATAIWTLRLLPEHELVRLLAQAYGYPGVDLRKSVIPAANLNLIDRDTLRSGSVLPVMDTYGGLVLAMVNPSDDTLAAKVAFHSGRKVLRHIAIGGALKQALDGCVKLLNQDGAQWKGKEAWNLDPGPEGRAAIVPPEPRPAGPAGQEELPVVFGKQAEAPEASADLGGSEPAFADTGGGRLIDFGEEKATKATVRHQAGAGKVVLIVDDDPVMRTLVLKIVQPLGCATLESGNGREALGLAKDARPNLVVLDSMLPGMHGFEVCRAIKGDPLLRSTAVLMMSGVHTGWQTGVDVSEVYGADGFFEKPFRMDDFRRAVTRLLAIGGGEDATKERRQAALDACRRASEEAKAGKLRHAISLLQEATTLDPYSAEPYFYLARALIAAGDSYRALASYERAVDLRPDLEVPLTELGQLYAKLGFRRSASQVFRRAAEVSQDAGRKQQLLEAEKRLMGGG
jgi:CheY-like chemotaxis protein